MEDDSKLDYLYVAARSHSGTTLLARMLGAQSSVLNLGEFKHFASYFDADEGCGCGASLQECEFWNRVVAEASSCPQPLADVCPTDGVRSNSSLASGLYYAGLLIPALLRIGEGVESELVERNLQRARNHWQFAVSAARVANASVLVDKSMSISRFLELYRTRPSEVRMQMVHLVRDGRGNTNSMLKRSCDSAPEAARAWRDINLRIEAVKASLAGLSARRVHYEELCRNPESVCSTLLRPTGPSIQGTAGLEEATDHGIGGNSGTFHGYDSIRLDERWKRRLTSSELDSFESVAGWLNRWYGYE